MASRSTQKKKRKKKNNCILKSYHFHYTALISKWTYQLHSSFRISFDRALCTSGCVAQALYYGPTLYFQNMVKESRNFINNVYSLMFRISDKNVILLNVGMCLTTWCFYTIHIMMQNSHAIVHRVCVTVCVCVIIRQEREIESTQAFSATV